MRVAFELCRHDLFQAQLNFERIFAGRQAGAVGDAEDMGVDRDGLAAEGDVQHHIGGFAPDAGQFFERFAAVRHLAAMLFQQQPRQRDHVFGLGAVKPDGLDEVADPCLAQGEHLFRAIGELEQRFGRLVDADIGRLGRQHHRHQERIGIDVLELGGGVRVGGSQNFEEARSRRRAHARGFAGILAGILARHGAPT